jgi:hypothetical protein
MASLLAMAEMSESALACTGVAGLLAAYALLSSFRCARRRRPGGGGPSRGAARVTRRAAVRRPPPPRPALRARPRTPATALRCPTRDADARRPARPAPPAPRRTVGDMDKIPGPWKKAWPVVGNLLECLRPDFHKVLLKWADDHGAQEAGARGAARGARRSARRAARRARRAARRASPRVTPRAGWPARCGGAAGAAGVAGLPR